MKALIYNGAENLVYDNVEMPKVVAGEFLVQVDTVGICGSDMHAYLGHDARRPAPLILGHEVSGHIIGGTQDGQAVTVNPLVGCGQCTVCGQGRANLCANRQIISMPPRQGGFADYITIPAQNCVSVPDGFDLSKAALAEPIACGWHAVRLGLQASFRPPEQALVFGGGAIGVGAGLSLLAQGVKQVTLVEPNPLRRRYLQENLPFNVVDGDDLKTLDTVSLIIDGVGYEATRQAACAVCAPGGVIMHIGLGSDSGGIDVRKITLQEITFIGTYTYTPQDFIDTAQAMFDGRLGALDWVETRALSQGAQAFVDIRNGAVLAPKILLSPCAAH